MASLRNADIKNRMSIIPQYGIVWAADFQIRVKREFAKWVNIKFW